NRIAKNDNRTLISAKSPSPSGRGIFPSSQRVITYLTNQAQWRPDLKLDEAKSQIRNLETSDWTCPICNFGFEILLRPISKSPPFGITQVYCCPLRGGECAERKRLPKRGNKPQTYSIASRYSYCPLLRAATRC